MPPAVSWGTPAVLGTLEWPADRFIGGLEEVVPETSGGGDRGGEGGGDGGCGGGIAGGGGVVLRRG